MNCLNYIGLAALGGLCAWALVVVAHRADKRGREYFRRYIFNYERKHKSYHDPSE